MGHWWAPRHRSWWTAVLFAAGSVCFLIAPLPAFLEQVGAHTVGVVFFAGSLLFTAAAGLQWLGTGPVRVDRWSSGIQLAGTVFFNVTTFRALTTAVDQPSYDQVVWRPDAFGSVCFLVSGYLAYVAVAGGPLSRAPRTRDGAVASVNLFGCVAFGLSALAGYVLPGTGGELDASTANAATSLGALGFLVGAVLLLPQGAHRR
jgi:hypothetical protein